MIPELLIYGDDYETADGTCERDYIHVQDLARAHVSAVTRSSSDSGFQVFNIGTGQGYSVRQVIAAFERASGRPVPHRVVDRPGDVPRSLAATGRGQRGVWLAGAGRHRRHVPVGLGLAAIAMPPPAMRRSA